MKNLKKIGFLLIITLFAINVNAQTKKEQKIIDDAREAKSMLLKEESNIGDFFASSAGYVIFPNVGKGAFIIGAASGNGVVYQKGRVIGMADLKKINVGFQAGGQAIIEAIFFETEKELNDFKEGNFEFSGEASAVILKSGKAVNAQYKDGVAVFALPKAGLMAEAAVGGQKFSYDPL
ncbi:lipid-binding SYLF domain-containing protein [Abyssalbus ytuae]|uniref:Lipid-binding SYLF domain-containing protein n=1 Tax=Abyssalbus ytuae TaxID=2926907 RepID=A0A9E6ZMH7_9FLAO|nr:lipid-binding SYLF domain-containing protein [Abyssalbus ytuae]UOB18569.1 lipid-binding SYLF domain-containing protein [Abyssalbus ytuae]